MHTELQLDIGFLYIHRVRTVNDKLPEIVSLPHIT